MLPREAVESTGVAGRTRGRLGEATSTARVHLLLLPLRRRGEETQMSVPSSPVPVPVPDSVREELSSPEFQADPYPVYGRLRAEAPVHRVETPIGVDTWMVTRYEDARAVLNDPRFTKDPRKAPDIMRKFGVPEGEGLIQRSMLNADPPDHTRLRGLVTKAFTRRRMEALRPRIQRITDDLLDGIASGEEVDFIGAFAFPLPVTVISELLGVPAERMDDFRRWSAGIITPPFSEEAKRVRQEGVEELPRYFGELVEERRAQVDPSVPPGSQPDLVRALIAAYDQEGSLDHHELIGMLTLILVAGHETTVNLIGNGMLALLRNPEQLALLRERPDLLPGAVEEVLRYDGPVERATMRIALADVEIGGLTVPKGALVTVVIGAAGRDPGRFPDADVFDITREDNPHVAFGHGIHHCLGAPLARLEGQIALGTVLRRFPVIELVKPDEEPPRRFTVGNIVRGVQALHLRMHANEADPSQRQG
ncbi:Cytochrome P450 [Sinosporangium album]|uniref:Cytochrome P450 n=1 Tax=Sinosporangium album TaxID=504805 RepID=A0A1G8IV14_9ACTN|nr:cytochrome P450 [Sinosporangium album]SDI22310.1 Cytochrome P450 [Sinosporangium album]